MIMEPAGDIGSQELDDASRPSWRLRFAPALERRFEDEVAAGRCRRLVMQNWIGLAIYLAFLAGDWILIRDIFWVSVALHLFVMSPIMVALNAILARCPPVWLRESLLALGIILATSVILGLTLVSRSPLRTSEPTTIVLVILFATMVQRIRFGYAVAACVVSAVLYVVAALQLSASGSWERESIVGAVFCGVVLFSLIGCWNMEREQRTNFLLSQRNRIRQIELETLSRRDPLTGAYNRRALDDALVRCSAAGNAFSMAVLLFDIDHFKSFNDVNGHLAGDACLRRVAEVIAANVRDSNVYRFGGEEFLVLLESVDLAGACAVAERVRQALAAASIPRERAADSSVVTVSAGVAAAVLNEAETIRHLVADADLALYAAKRGGRNQVRSASAANALPLSARSQEAA